jgi:hypothetical protein
MFEGKAWAYSCGAIYNTQLKDSLWALPVNIYLISH